MVLPYAIVGLSIPEAGKECGFSAKAGVDPCPVKAGSAMYDGSVFYKSVTEEDDPPQGEPTGVVTRLNALYLYNV